MPVLKQATNCVTICSIDLNFRGTQPWQSDKIMLLKMGCVLNCKNCLNFVDKIKQKIILGEILSPIFLARCSVCKMQERSIMTYSGKKVPDELEHLWMEQVSFRLDFSSGWSPLDEGEVIISSKTYANTEIKV